MGEPSPGTRRSERPSEDRLDSWKEIAAYLGRDVTTVQRWEKREGMPVHRHVHDKRGSVYAVESRAGCLAAKPQAALGEEDEEKEPEAPGEARGDRAAKSDSCRARAGLLWLGSPYSACLPSPTSCPEAARSNAAQPKIRSLAVLPLKNLSGDPAQEYLADGMTEALIGRLSAIHDLRVISRTSVMRFKNPQISVPEIARTLGVDAIVEGSVMREGNRIRVTAQLIRGATDEHFWSETYDRELRDALDSAERAGANHCRKG